MNYLAAISLLAVVVTLYLGIIVFLRNPTGRLNRLCLMYCLSTTYWSLTEFGLLQAGNYGAAYLWIKASFLWPFAIPLLLHFILVFTEKDDKINSPFAYLILYMPAGIVALFELTTNLISGFPVRIDWGWATTRSDNPLYSLSMIWAAALPLFGLYLCLRFYQKAGGKIKKYQARYVLIGLAVLALLGITSEVIAPLLKLGMPRLTTLGFVLASFFWAYAVWRHKLFVLSTARVAEEIIALLPDLLLITNSEDRITTVNDATLKLLGFGRDKFIGQPLEIVFPAGDKAVSAGNIETTIRTKDSRQIPVLVSSTAVLDENGQQQGRIILASDITELKRYRENLEELVKERTAELENARRATVNLLKDVEDDRNKITRLYKDLQVVDRMKTEFMSILSHELRTPLTPVKGYLALFLEEKFGPLPPAYKQAAGTILKQSNHLLMLIDNILDVARLTAGHGLTLNKEPLSLRTVIYDLLEIMGPQFGERQIKVEADLPKDLPTILADNVKIRRLFTNLLGNALKFTPLGGTLRIGGFRRDNTITIRLADNGIGVAQEKLEKIFEKFYQVDSSYTRAAGGLGLGLTIAREIVEAHGGKIWAESEGLGKGTAIVINLPLAQQ